MLKVILADNHQKERQYAIKVILSEWLGINYSLEFRASKYAAELILPNGKQLLVEDHFFNKVPSNSTYLSIGNIPTNITYANAAQIPFLSDKDIPIIFGNTICHTNENSICCNIDIFASSFFMLTRWEEYVNKTRDQHNRFPGTASIAYKNNFLRRPIVNEYVEMLWNLLVYLGIDQKRKERKFRAIVTHDVDSALLWRNPYVLIKKLGGDIIKRNNWSEAKYSLNSYSKFKSGKTKDPYDTFDNLMEVSEKNGLQSHFYFLCGGQHKEDNALPLSHPFVKNLLKKINDRGHIIGFHPSFNSYNDPEIFKHELAVLHSHTNQPIEYGRQHFLRFEVPTTWRLWEEAGLKYDSTMYYADAPGFRCGTCYEFPVFDILERSELGLKEIPLIAMEVTWQIYKNSSPLEMCEEIKSLIDTCKKYNGDFVLLWHNSSFYGKDEKEQFNIYEQLISNIN